jgi:hypothetical protein
MFPQRYQDAEQGVAVLAYMHMTGRFLVASHREIQLSKYVNLVEMQSLHFAF